MLFSPRTIFVALFIILPKIAFAINLFNFSMYTKQNIEAYQADIQGAVASSGDISLSQYQVDSTLSSTRYTLIAKGDIQLFSTSVGKYDQMNRNIGEIFGNDYFIYNSYDVSKISTQVPNLNELSNQMDTLESKVLSIPNHRRLVSINKHSLNFNHTNQNIVKIVLESHEIENRGRLTLYGKKDQIIILEIQGDVVDINNTGFELIGLEKENVLLYFKHAKEVYLTTSGYVGDLSLPIPNRIGMPFSILAPKAKVFLYDALLTGAIYAKSFYSPRNGQINFGLFNGNKLSKANPSQAKVIIKKTDRHSFRRDLRTPDQIWNGAH